MKIRTSIKIDLTNKKQIKSNLKRIVKQNIPLNLSNYKKRQLNKVKKLIMQKNNEEAINLIQKFFGITKNNKVRKNSIIFFKSKNSFLNFEKFKYIKTNDNFKRTPWNKKEFLESLIIENLEQTLIDYNIKDYFKNFVSDTDKGWTNRVRENLKVPDDISDNDFYNILKSIFSI